MSIVTLAKRTLKEFSADDCTTYAQAIAYAKCTAVSCIGNPTWPLDLVSKTRTCYTAGSCSNQAGGFASCTNSSCFQP